VVAAGFALAAGLCGGCGGAADALRTADAAGEPMAPEECRSRLQALQADTEAARRQTLPAQETYRNNPSSFEAKTTVELALQRAARIGADNAREAERLAEGPCKGRL